MFLFVLFFFNFHVNLNEITCCQQLHIFEYNILITYWVYSYIFVAKYLTYSFAFFYIILRDTCSLHTFEQK